MSQRDVRKYVQSLNATRAVQETLRNADTMKIIQAKADKLRQDHTDLSDEQLGWVMADVAEHIAQAVVAVRTGQAPPQLVQPDNLSVLYLMLAREFLELWSGLD